jgi:hypothetical protein
MVEIASPIIVLPFHERENKALAFAIGALVHQFENNQARTKRPCFNKLLGNLVMQA